MIKDTIGLNMGQITVETTSNRGHAPEFWLSRLQIEFVVYLSRRLLI